MAGNRWLKEVLVTGASGFLGGRIVSELVSRGIAVRGQTRSAARADAIAAIGAVPVVAELAPARGLEAALEGCDGVIHCAGGGRAVGEAPIWRANLDPTRNLRNATDAPLVLISSISSRGPGSSDRPVSIYGRAKRAAEARVLNAEPPGAVLRPPAIYGPGDDRMAPIFRAVARGLMPLPAGGGDASLVHVDDCARAAVLALIDPAADGRIYDPEDGVPLSLKDVARTIAPAVGRDPATLRFVGVPSAALWVAGAGAEVVSGLLGRTPGLTRDKVRDIRGQSWVCDAGPLIAELGWTREHTLASAAPAIAADYRARGKL